MRTTRLPVTTLLNALALPLLCVIGGVWFLVDPHDETVSEVENRALAKFPAFTWDRLARGHYTRDLDQYVADHFPLRERFVAVAFWVKAHRGPQRDTAVYDAPSLEKGGLERAEDWVVDDADAGPDAVGDAGVHEEGDVVDAGPSEGPFAPDNVKVKDGVFVADGRALMLFTGNAEHGRQYADVVNAYAEALTDVTEQGVQVHNIVTPTATAFYMPESALARTRSERAHIDAMAAQLAPNVMNADVYAELAPHAARAASQVGDEVYYKTDHHWTGLGAYYGYRAWAKAAGVTPVQLSALEKKTKGGYSGSLYRMTQDRTLLKSVKDDVTDYWLPAVDYTAVAYKTTDLKTVVATRFLDEREHGYLVFLGWDHPLMIAKTDVDNGKRALLVKNSYGNAFAPWLLHHFEQVVVVDYRYYSGSIMSLVKKHGITDVILVGAVSTTASLAHHRRLKAVLKGSGTVWDPVSLPSEAKAQEPPK